ncbi:MAG TPA: adenylate/guanylate cyclase domain-containing protein [Pseudomonadales bacterium]
MSTAVRQWLETLGLAQYGDRFEAEDIDLDVLPSLSEQDLGELGVSMGHRKKLLKAIADRRSNLSPAAPSNLETAAFASLPPRAYTPKHLADRILQSRSALEGERKQVTVLFADVKGSMELAEQLDPEEWHRILERFFAILTDGVHRFEGTVNQYTGDGIMALFGAPLAHEDHAQRACYAALALRDELAHYATEVRREHGVGFSTRMGINSGDVVVGRIGDDLRMDYTAQGHTVGLAQRMESMAEPNTCFVSESTAALVSGYFTLDDLGEFRIKGVTDPVPVYRLAGTGTARTRLDISRSRGLSRFVGRAGDLRTLEDALEQARNGNGQVIGVVAEAGTGKSRLCFEFLESCRAQGVRVLIGRAVAHGRNIPFLPILEIFRAWFEITPQDDAQRAREKIAGRMVLLDPALTETLPSLFEFLSVGDPSRPSPATSPKTRQREIIGVMRQVVQSHDQPTVTMIEDLHWLDAASDEFLSHLVEARAGSRSLLLLNFRPEYHADWMQKSWYRQIPLNPLTAEALAELLVDLLGTDSSLAPLATALHARTGGNPFFTEEIVQSLIEAGALQGTRGAYRLVTSIDRLEVPATVQAVLAARIDRLADREKRLLQVASVIGKDFAESLLTAVAGLPADELKAALTALEQGEFVYPQAIYPTVEYTFKHPLTQEVTLSSLLRERRRALHADVARAIEAAGGDLDEGAPLLAHHWEQAADLPLAVRWHARAAGWAGSKDPMGGLRHWIQVRALGQSLSDVESRVLRFQACKTLLISGSFRLGLNSRETSDCLDECRALADTAGIAPFAMAAPIAGAAISEYQRGNVNAALVLTAEAQSFVQPGIDAEDGLWVLITDSFAHMLSGDFDNALKGFEMLMSPEGIDKETELHGLRVDLFAQSFSAYVLAAAGRFRTCWPRLQGALRFARKSDTFNFGTNTFAMSAYLAGGVQGSDLPDLLRTSLDCIENADPENLSASMHAPLYLGAGHFLNGSFADADAALTAALTKMREAGTALEWHCGYVAVHADTCRALGDTDRAISQARYGIEFADAGGLRFQAAACRAALADVLVLTDAPDGEVETILNEARALVEDTGGKSLLPRLREAEVRLRARTHPDALLAGLREAESMYRQLGALGHADRLSREIAG